MYILICYFIWTGQRYSVRDECHVQPTADNDGGGGGIIFFEILHCSCVVVSESLSDFDGPIAGRDFPELERADWENF